MLSLTSPRHTPAHDWRAGPKIAALALVTFALFLPAPGFGALSLAAAVWGLSALTLWRWGLLGAWLRLFPALWPVALLLVVWHAIDQSPLQGGVILARMAAAVGAANLVTMTTRLSDLQGLVLWATRPFGRLIPAKALSLAIALMIRFVPVMADRADTLAQSWRARSARRPHVRLLAPLALSALDDAEQVALALRARGGVQ
jgi:biotin transport system permease protein